MPRNRMTWRMKLIIAFVVISIFLMAAAMTPWGHDFAKGWIRDAYNNMPEEERRTSSYASAWVSLAWWCASIRGDEKEGMEMYLEFCGALPDPKTNLDFTSTLKLTGLCSQDGTTGWGPMHPLAPKAYYQYMELVESLRSAQVHNEEMFRAHRLFYQWCSRFGEKAINPCFKKYWIKMRDRGAFRRVFWPPDIDRNVLSAPESPEDC
jgi:hypothetical protein